MNVLELLHKKIDSLNMAKTRTRTVRNSSISANWSDVYSRILGFADRSGTTIISCVGVEAVGVPPVEDDAEEGDFGITNGKNAESSCTANLVGWERRRD